MEDLFGDADDISSGSESDAEAKKFWSGRRKRRWRKGSLVIKTL